MKRRLLSLATLVLVAGCDLPFDSPVCTLEAAPGIVVFVTDSLTGDTLRGYSRVIATDGAFVDTARVKSFQIPAPVPPDTAMLSPYLLAFERAGTYRVRVERAGFRTWERANVAVHENDCHVATRELDARLQRQ